MPFIPAVELTTAGTAPELPAGTALTVPVSELIAYHQQTGFTRVVLVGKRSLDVKEPTEEIDRLVRSAVQKAPFNRATVWEVAGPRAFDGRPANEMHELSASE